MNAQEFRKVVEARLRETGQTRHSAAVSHGLPGDAVARVLSGTEPKLDRVAQICEALDLELYIGPRREAFAGLDPFAFALALRHMESTIALMIVGELDDADMLPYFETVYGHELRVLERVVASGRSREEAAALLGKRMAPLPPEQRPELSDIMERRRALRTDRDAAAIVYEALHAPAAEPGAEEAPAEPDPAEKP